MRENWGTFAMRDIYYFFTFYKRRKIREHVLNWNKRNTTIYYLLYIVYYLLSTIYYLLSTIYYLLSTIYYLLSTIYYLLSTTSGPRRAGRRMHSSCERSEGAGDRTGRCRCHLKFYFDIKYTYVRMYIA